MESGYSLKPPECRQCARNGHLVHAALLPLKGRDNVRLRTAPKSFVIFKDFCSSARKQFGL